MTKGEIKILLTRIKIELGVEETLELLAEVAGGAPLSKTRARFLDALERLRNKLYNQER
jgi:hypothetical protein